VAVDPLARAVTARAAVQGGAALVLAILIVPVRSVQTGRRMHAIRITGTSGQIGTVGAGGYPRGGGSGGG